VGDGALVIGVGNSMRGDDAVGPVVAASLGDQAEAQVIVSDGDPGVLIELWKEAGRVVIVDAMASGRPVGDVFVFDASSTPLPAGIRLGSSHHLGVAEAVELARVLERLPECVIVVGVEAGSFETGADLSTSVRGAVPSAVAAVERALAGA
jgi:hydrogenase maturation protease